MILLIHPKLLMYHQRIEKFHVLSGRYIGENIRLLFDIMEYAEENDIPGLFLLIDFEKAFDSISWNFLNFLNYTHNLKNQ
jgi:hypothetical protein